MTTCLTAKGEFPAATKSSFVKLERPKEFLALKAK